MQTILRVLSVSTVNLYHLLGLRLTSLSEIVQCSVWLQNESLPSAFEHHLDCSDWSLRLSHVSLTPTSDRSTAARRRVTIDKYLSERTHKLGALDGISDERVRYDDLCLYCRWFFHASALYFG